MNYLLIGIGGALGAMSRYWLGKTVQSLVKNDFFPFGTMTVNMVGCLLIGYLMGLVEYRGLLGTEGRLLLVVGLLGGFTTFSSFSYETLQLIKSGDTFQALTNIAIQTCGGLILVWIGNLASR